MDWAFKNLRPLSYGLIWADPAWLFKNYSEAGEEKNASAQYDCMPTEEIAALPVGHLAAGDCWLWLWATSPMITDALAVMDAWGFEFVTSGVWVKRSKDKQVRNGSVKRGKLAFGTGYVLRCASEPFLIGKVGKPKTFSKSIRTVIEAPRRQHSRKPEEAYEVAETLFGDVNRANLFTRQTRPGWDSWGDQANLFDAGDPVSLKRLKPHEQREPEPMPLFEPGRMANLSEELKCP